jgi:hypothetical protein
MYYWQFRSQLFVVFLSHSRLLTEHYRGKYKPTAAVSSTYNRSFVSNYLTVKFHSKNNSNFGPTGTEISFIYAVYIFLYRSLLPRGLRRGSAVAHLLELRVRILPGAWMSVSCECCVLLGRGHRVWPITRPEESYQLRCIWVWSTEREQCGSLGPLGLSNHEKV